jgi:hypothetical protein
LVTSGLTICQTRPVRVGVRGALGLRVRRVTAPNALPYGLSGPTGTARLDLVDRVVDAVHRHVQPRREQVLVDGRAEAGRDSVAYGYSPG